MVLHAKTRLMPPNSQTHMVITLLYLALLNTINSINEISTSAIKAYLGTKCVATSSVTLLATTNSLKNQFVAIYF